MKLVDWGPEVNAHVATYIFLFPKQTGFGLHMHRATSTNRRELLWDGSAGQCASSGLVKTHRNFGSGPAHHSGSQKSVQSQRGRLAFIKTTDLTHTVIWWGAFLRPVPLLHRKQSRHKPENCWRSAYAVQFEHIKPLEGNSADTSVIKTCMPHPIFMWRGNKLCVSE